jgi:hypothetical protein
MFDGGGPGRSGARFSSGDTGGLDQNQDNYISEQEYQRGQSNAESNADRNITGEIGDAYNNSRGVVSNFSNSFGALPRGSIRQEAALGPQYGTPIETKNMARYLQMGGMPGAAIRGVSGFLGGAADAAGDMGRALTFQEQRAREEQTPEQQARSYDSIFNTGARTVPQDVIEGTRSLNPRLGQPMAMPANVPVNNVEVSTAASTADASDTSYVVNAEDMGGGMVKVFYGDNSSEIMPTINYQLMMQNYV